MNENKYDIGMVGLGVMGRNLLLNMADHNFSVVGFDKDEQKVEALKTEGKDKKVHGVKTLKEFVNALKTPRAVIMLVPAGAPVDNVINDLLPLMGKGDLIIDGGNSHYIDTDRHAKELSKTGINFLGVGISGGEEGARFGPSIMPGGPKDAYERVKPIFEAAAAKTNDEPCVTYLGPGSSGHYVKMVHNGIEYGLMQLISESYDFMKRALNLNNDELHEVFSEWNKGSLQSFLVEITAGIFKQPDDKTNNRLVDMILDAARQKGTGKWTSQDAMDLQVPIPNIDAAVSMRDMSGYKEERIIAEKIFPVSIKTFDENKKNIINKLENAVYFATIITYAQGLALLSKASAAFNYNINLSEVAKIWRGGCIIRAALLEDITAAYKRNHALSNLLVDNDISQKVLNIQNDVRYIINTAVNLGIPVPGLSLSIAYFDAYRSGRMPSNLVQAQRDYFGAHTYQRIDQPGIFHTKWNQV